MRGVITCSGIIVVIALIVMIHASITGNNIRRDEVNRSLDGAIVRCKIKLQKVVNTFDM